MLISQKQHQSNCRNALLSTGPITDAGKAAVRLNALRHGLRARSLLLPGENAGDLQQLCEDLESEWKPQNRTEQLLVEQMAVAQWKLARLEVGERSIFIQTMPAERQLALLDRFSAQRSRLERSFSRAMHEIAQIRKTKPFPDQPGSHEKQQPATHKKNSPPVAYVMADPDGAVSAGAPSAFMMSPARPGSR